MKLSYSHKNKKINKLLNEVARILSECVRDVLQYICLDKYHLIYIL